MTVVVAGPLKHLLLLPLLFLFFFFYLIRLIVAKLVESFRIEPTQTSDNPWSSLVEGDEGSYLPKW